jgi:hypothetical protein
MRKLALSVFKFGCGHPILMLVPMMIAGLFVTPGDLIMVDRFQKMVYRMALFKSKVDQGHTDEEAAAIAKEFFPSDGWYSKGGQYLRNAEDLARFFPENAIYINEARSAELIMAFIGKESPNEDPKRGIS